MTSHLDSIIQKHGLEVLTSRFYDMLRHAVKNVDLQKYGFFGALMLNEDIELGVPFADLSSDDQNTAKKVVDEFTKVRIYQSFRFNV